jgi:hypothetical protein
MIMKKISQRLVDNGFICRTEATISKEAYKFISHYAIDHDIKTFGESIDAIMTEVEAIHFSELFIDYENKQIKISEAAAIKIKNVLSSLTEKYQKSDDAVNALKEVTESIRSISLIPGSCGGQGKFIDCYVGIDTQNVFERISKLYKHQGSKSIVIEAMVNFMINHTES